MYKMLMLALAPPGAVGRVAGTNVILSGGTNSFGSQLAGAISQGSSTADLRPQCAPVLEWEGLKDVSCAVCGKWGQRMRTSNMRLHTCIARNIRMLSNAHTFFQRYTHQ